MTILNDASEWELALEDEGYDSGNESLNIPNPLHRTSHLCHISAGQNLSFGPATPITHQAYSPQWPSNLNAICQHLRFANDDDSSVDSSPLHGRTEQSLPVEQQMAQHLTDDSFQDFTSADKEEEEVEEHFPTAVLNDDVWMEEPVLDMHLCISEQSQPHDLDPYPYSYSLDQLHPTSEYTSALQYMDLSDIFNFPYMMTTVSDEDIPSLEDVLDFEKWTSVCINLNTHQTPLTHETG